MTKLRSLLFASAAISAALVSHAQTAPDNLDETLVLPEFNVTGEDNDSYVASETTTGSRMREKVQNLPFPIQVISHEFLRDFGFFDLDENFNFSSTYQSMDTENGTQRVRGLGATKSLRDGFSQIGMLADPVSIDRLETIKGASAAMYGETQPGGMTNIISKRPKTKPQYRLSASYGDYDLFRGTIEATGPLSADRKTAYLLAGGYYETGYEQDYARLRQRSLSGAISHQFSDRTNLFLRTEHIFRSSGTLTPIGFARNTSIADPTKRVTRLATELGEINVAGPNAFQRREVNSATLIFEHKVNDIISTRFGANWFNRQNWNFTQIGTLVYELAGANAGKVSRSPSFGSVTEDAGSIQVDIIARYWMANRKLENRTLLTLDFFSNYHTDPVYNLPTGAATVPGTIGYLAARGLFAQTMDPFAPNPNFNTPAYTPANFNRITRWNHNRTNVYGISLRHQVAAFRDVAFLYGGLRHDLVRYSLANKAAAAMAGDPSLITTEKGSDRSTTPSAGINVKVVNGVRAYANYARSFFANTQNRSVGANTQSEKGSGFDYGFKVSLLESRLNFTIGGYYVQRYNVGVDIFDDAVGALVNQQIGKTRSRGFEFDASWQVSSLTTALFGLGTVDAVVTEAGRDIDQVGRQVPRQPYSNAYLALRHSFRNGALRGLSATLGVTYTGKSYPFTTSGGIAQTTGDRLIVSNDGSRDISIPGYYATRAGISYSWRAKRKYSQTIGINVTNLLDDDYLQTNRRFVQPFGGNVTYSVRY